MKRQSLCQLRSIHFEMVLRDNKKQLKNNLALVFCVRSCKQTSRITKKAITTNEIKVLVKQKEKWKKVKL